MLTEDERVRARHHLGYLGVDQAFAFVLGVPASVQTQFMIEGSFGRLMPQSEPMFRKILCKLDAIEEQIDDNQENLAVTKIDEININPREFEQLLDRYMYQRTALANMLGCQPNPWDQRFKGWNGGGGVSVAVNH